MKFAKIAAVAAIAGVQAFEFQVDEQAVMPVTDVATQVDQFDGNPIVAFHDAAIEYLNQFIDFANNL